MSCGRRSYAIGTKSSHPEAGEIGWADPVTAAHGGPARLYVAPMYGYKSIKWLDMIEVSEKEPRPGYWEVRGYDTHAWIGKSNGRDDRPV